MLYVYRFLWPLHLGWLLVCCLVKEFYLQIFKCVSLWIHGCCGKWEGWVHKPDNHTSWVAVVSPTDRPKSVRNRCVIELFVALFVLSPCPFDITTGVGAFVRGLSQTSSLFSWNRIENNAKFFLQALKSLLCSLSLKTSIMRRLITYIVLPHSGSVLSGHCRKDLHVYRQLTMSTSSLSHFVKSSKQFWKKGWMCILKHIHASSYPLFKWKQCVEKSLDECSHTLTCIIATNTLD